MREPLSLAQLVTELERQQISVTLDHHHDLTIRAAKGVLDEQLLAALRFHKAELVALLLQQQQGEAIVHRSSDCAPVSSLQQQSLWAHCLAREESAAPAGTAYQIPLAVVLQGALDIPRLAAAFDALVARHAILGYCYPEVLGAPLPQPSSTPPVLEVDATPLTAADQKQLEALAEGFLAEGTPITTGPLLRARLVRLADDSGIPAHLLLFNIHHLITDGWSNRILFAELLALYRNGSEAAPDATPAIDYFDYALWQQQALARGTLRDSLALWQERIADCEALPLPGSVSPAITTTTLPVSISREEATQLREFARAQGVSLFALLLAAWQLLLHKVTGSSHFATACPVAGRNRPELHEVVGYLVNTLPLVADFRQPLTLAELLLQCQREVLFANSHAEVPLAAITADPQPFLLTAILHETDTLFETATLTTPAGELIATPLTLPVAAGKFPLALLVSDRTALQLAMEYDTARFAPAFATCLPAYFRKALLTLMKEPALPVRRFSLLTPEEEWLLISRGFGPTVPLPADNLNALLTAQAERTPQATAVSAETGSLSYEALHQLAAQLAVSVFSEIGQGKIVAVAITRSPELSVALLGILKSGNAYLPIDPELPPQRQAFLLRDSGAALLLTTDKVSLQRNHQPPPEIPPVAADSLFNLIYTSGSTGNPKGVRVGERAITNRLLWMQSAFPIGVDDTVLQKTPISFDVSVWELFWPLLTGARLHYAKPGGHRDAAYLRDTIREESVTVVHFVPSMLTLFLECDNLSSCSCLRLVFCSGEALPWKEARALQQQLPHAALHNLYGPTEAAVDVSHFDCQATISGSSCPIGKPISNTQLHILDERQRPVVPGAIGELFIGGLCLAEGYHQLPELSRARFLDNPWYLDGHPSPRLYQTGDLCRQREDGDIEFLGRNDFQVKVRGVRIETGEIEATALDHPAIRQALVMAANLRGADAASRELLLFATVDGATSPAELRSFLAVRLPSSHIPNRIVLVDTMPLTASGKTDRKALLASLLQEPVTPTRPLTAREEEVKTIWESHFGFPVDADTPFFELGGHSLLASRIIHALATRFGVELHLADLFTHSTVAALTLHINQQEQRKQLRILPQPTSEPLPLSSQQQRIFLFQQLMPNSPAYHMPAALLLEGTLHIALLERSLQRVVERHTILQSVYRQTPDGPRQQTIPGYRFQLGYVESPVAAGDRNSLLALAQQEAARPFPLEAEPPLRATLFALGEGRHLFTFTLHHIAGDATSLEILLHEVTTTYRALLSGHEPTLPPLPIQYGDYAAWQQGDAARARAQQHLAFWQAELAAVPELVSVPLHRERPPLPDTTGAQLVMELAPDLVERLFAFCRSEQLTPFMVLLPTYQLLLTRLAHQEDLCVGIPATGRDHPQLSQLVGFFVHSLAMRCQVEENPSVREFLARQKARFLVVLQHQELALEEILATLPIKRSTAYTPVVQFGFNLLQGHEGHRIPALPGLAITAVEAPVTVAKQEMTWIFYPHANGIRLAVEYQSALFQPDTITRWMGCFSTLLSALLDNPTLPVARLPLLPHSEIVQQLQGRFPQLVSALPLAPMQMDLYLGALVAPDSAQNALGFVTESLYPLDPALLECVLYRLYAHADALRSVITPLAQPEAEIAWQLVLPVAERLPEGIFTFTHHGEAPLTETVREALVRTTLHTPYAEALPLWRVAIHRFGQRHLFILAAHHAMFDGASIQFLGRLIKGNYERQQRGEPPQLPANNFARFVEESQRETDRSACRLFWCEKMRDAVAIPAEGHWQRGDAVISHTVPIGGENLGWLQKNCLARRTTPALFCKLLFALAIRRHFSLAGNLVFAEVVTGRSKEFRDTQGLFFQQQPNLLPTGECDGESTVTTLLRYFSRQRKELPGVTPLSLHRQRTLSPNALPWIFNFYPMESSTPFFGQPEAIEHRMPVMDDAVNLIVRMQEKSLLLQLDHPATAVHGEAFLATMLAIFCEIRGGEERISALLPLVVSTPTTQPALPQPPQPLQRELIPPRNAAEREMLAHWQEVLGQQEISVTDNFFELGGHSLLAMRIANRLQQQRGQPLPVDVLFTHPTIEALANYLAEEPPLPSALLPPLQVVPPQTDWPLSPLQERLWVLSQLEEGNAAYHISVALRLEGILNRTALALALQALLANQQVLTSRIISTATGPRVVFSAPETITIEEFSLVNAPFGTSPIATALDRFATRPFQLDGGPLLRIGLWEEPRNSHVLSLVLHHLIGDGESLVILGRLLATLYRHFVDHPDSPPTPLPAPMLQYHHYALWQQQLSSHPVIDQQLAWWKEELADVPYISCFPLDHPRPMTPRHDGAVFTTTLPQELSDKVRQLARLEGSSLFALLLTSFGLLLSLTSSREDVVIGIIRDGRNRRELELLAGCFVQLLPVRIRQRHNLGFSALLQQSARTLQRAMANADVPPGRVLAALNLPHNAQILPVVQTVFNYLKGDAAPAHGLPFGDLTITPVVTPVRFAKTELSCTVHDSGDALAVAIEYNSALYDSSTPKRIVAAWQQLLTAITADPAAHIQAIESRLFLPEPVSGIRWQPLTSIQRDLLFASLAEPESLQNSIGYALELPVELDVALFRDSLRALEAHHPMLRATLHDAYGSHPCLAIAEETEPSFTLLDWSSEIIPEAALEQRLRQRVHQPWELEEGTLHRNYLVKLRKRRWYTVLACHHLLLDGLSFTHHAHGLVTGYLARKNGTPHTLPPDHFSDYVTEHQTTFDQPETIRYWREQLANCQPLSARPEDRESDDVRLVSQKVDPGHLAEVMAFCRRNRTTPALYYLSLYALLVRLYCQQRGDFVILDYATGRSREHATSLGCYYQRIFAPFLSAQFSGTVEEFLHSVRETRQRHKSRQRLSLSAQEDLLPQGNLRFSYNFFHMPKSGSAEGIDFGGHSFSPQSDELVDLRVQLDLGELTLSLSYPLSSFAENRLLDRLQWLSQQLLSGTTRIDALSALLPGESGLIRSPLAPPPFLPLSEKVLRQALATPEAVAIIAGESSLTYGELERWSAAIAAQLQQRGIGKGQRVAILLERSLALLPAILGTLRAGACYLPIDPTYPAERLLYQLEDSSASILLSSATLVARLALSLPTATVDVDSIRHETPAAFLPPAIEPNDPFYLIYTSGSTGLPKGSLVYQKSTAALVEWYRTETATTADSRVLVFSSPGFDLTQKNLFLPLTTGATLVLYPDAHYDPAAICTLLADQHITHINCAPSAFYPLLDEAAGKRFAPLSTLQTIGLGGEVIDTERLLPWVKKTKFTPTLLNMYGPTECSDIASCHRLSRDELRGRKPIPLGQPIPGATLLLLDTQSDQPVPPGIPGEIAIAGLPVGGGYWQRPDLQAEAFRPNTLATHEGEAVLYRTGDIGLLVSNPSEEPALYFEGRVDDRIKLHGQRIEPGEVKRALQTLPGVRDAVVLVNNDRLLAFVLSDRALPLDWRNQLLEWLPSSQVPASLRVLSSFPLTPHGKIDLRALLALPIEPGGEEPTAARDRNEARMLALWQEVLGTAQIGIHDNFFELGGTSLLAVQLAGRIRKEWEVHLPVASLFSAQTIAELCHLLQQPRERWMPLAPIQPLGDRTPIFAFHAIGGLVFHYRPMALSIGLTQPLFGVQMRGLDSDSAPFRTLEEMVECYADAITTCYPDGPYRLLGHSFGGLLAVEVARKLVADGHDVSQLVLLDTFPPNRYLAALADDALLLKVFVEHNFGITGLSWWTLHGKSEEERIELLANLPDMPVGKDFLQRSTAILRSIRTMMESYQLRPVSVPILLLRPEKPARALRNSTLGWEKLTPQLTTRVIPGDHHSMVNFVTAEMLGEE